MYKKIVFLTSEWKIGINIKGNRCDLQEIWQAAISLRKSKDFHVRLTWCLIPLKPAHGVSQKAIQGPNALIVSVVSGVNRKGIFEYNAKVT
jgi:hypothetical protein